MVRLHLIYKIPAHHFKLDSVDVPWKLGRRVKAGPKGTRNGEGGDMVRLHIIYKIPAHHFKLDSVDVPWKL
jgi:hypothetical protein